MCIPEGCEKRSGETCRLFSHPSGMQFVNGIDPGVSKTQPLATFSHRSAVIALRSTKRSTAEKHMRDHIHLTRNLAFSSGVRVRLTRSLTRARSESMGLHSFTCVDQ